MAKEIALIEGMHDVSAFQFQKTSRPKETKDQAVFWFKKISCLYRINTHFNTIMSENQFVASKNKKKLYLGIVFERSTTDLNTLFIKKNGVSTSITREKRELCM